jgi:nicotinamidase/pyrazinamidase
MPEALVVVDFQNDFTPGGALGVPGGDAIADRVNELAASGRFDLVVATRDWHPRGHGSFTERGGIWPVHCVQGTAGAELYPGLDRTLVDVIVDKGQDPGTEGYSGFEATELESLLRERGIDRITVVGLATDYCVKNTVLDARRLGFDVTVDEDAIRAVNVEPGDGERAIEEMRATGATVS